jgi:hypothetical protein
MKKASYGYDVYGLLGCYAVYDEYVSEECDVGVFIPLSSR